MSVCTAAKIAPYSAVPSPSPSVSKPHHHGPTRNRSRLTRSSPYTPTLSIRPLIIAETGEGAAGWASGSQTCSGTRPALAPNPNKASTKATLAQAGASVAPRIAANVICQLPPCSTPKHSRMPRAPTWAISK